MFAACLDATSAGATELKSVNNVTVLEMDVTSDTSVDVTHHEILEKLRQLDMELHAVVNNAGVASGIGYETSKLAVFKSGTAMLDNATTVTALLLVMDVNLEGQLRVALKFLPLLRMSKGRIVNMGSMGAYMGAPFSGAANV